MPLTLYSSVGVGLEEEGVGRGWLNGMLLLLLMMMMVIVLVITNW